MIRIKLLDGQCVELKENEALGISEHNGEYKLFVKKGIFTRSDFPISEETALALQNGTKLGFIKKEDNKDVKKKNKGNRFDSKSKVKKQISDNVDNIEEE